MSSIQAVPQKIVDALEAHKQAVAEVSVVVRGFYDRNEPFRIFHGSTNSTRTAPKQSKVVDLCKLHNVINIDVEGKTVLVEPNVPMDRLIEATLPYGLVPPVVMDFPGITVGGGYAGTSGESSSFRHGFFDQTINWVEMVLGNGEIVRCSPTERSDLLRSGAGAVGSLGIATLFELRLDEAKTHVQVTYHRVNSVQEAADMIQRETKVESNSYIDGIMYAKDHGVVITGQTINTPPSGAPIQSFSGPSDPWYFLHVKTKTEKLEHGTTVEEAIPLADYLFRYDRGGFWVGKMAFEYMFNFPFNNATRRLLDDFMHTRMLYTALHASGVRDNVVIQDLAMPYDAVTEFVDWQERELDIWPLWLCPLRTQTAYRSFHPHTASKSPDDAMLNVGLWGFFKPPASSSLGSNQTLLRDEYVQANKAIESKLAQMGGRKWLYAQTFYDEAEFWAQYGGREWYDELRTKYHAQTLPSVFDKVRRPVTSRGDDPNRWSWWTWITSTRPLPAFWGLWQGIQTGDYVEARKAGWRTIKIGNALRDPLAKKL